MHIPLTHAAAALTCLLVVSACNAQTGTDGPQFGTTQFNDHWFDGKAEINGYELSTPRYGSVRKGVAITVFVTEPFSNSARVKADPGKHPPTDVFNVMKLNLIEDFPTGVYDYNLMTSVFVALAPVNQLPAGTPTKISFSAQEWCGHTYEQLLFDSGSIRRTSHSYFDGEADITETIESPKDGLSEDALLFWARGMAGPAVPPGQSIDVPLLRSVSTVRLNHVAMEWTRARLTRGSDLQNIKVPAGSFDVSPCTVEVNGGRMTWKFFVEKAFPHRIIRWERSDGQKAELLGSERLIYWQMNGPGFENALKRFGLEPRPPRTP